VRLVQADSLYVGDPQPLDRHSKLLQQEILRDRIVFAITAVTGDRFSWSRPVILDSPVRSVGKEWYPVEVRVDSLERIALGTGDFEQAGDAGRCLLAASKLHP